MPKSVALNDKPRRRKAKAARQKERGVIMQMLVRSPKDTLAGALAATAVLAIAVNALFLQAGRHPSPLFGTAVTLPKPAASAPPAEHQAAALVPATPMPVPAAAPASPMPRPRPVEAGSSDPIGNLVRATSTSAIQTSNVVRPPAPVPAAAPSRDPLANLIVSSQRVAAVQRALTDYGYGQLKATGTVGADTQAAIQKFERERKLPVTGQLSERVVRELSAATGRNFD
ncbi:peptidoglycan-binding protein [Afipia sp. P52-10]|uniref:peptidoglycan-binding domain-containing protein n=1 Tax=Afipia sp. P52-10 TaxID=1429916 RepID=UPI0003DF2A3B|nr:peptidoglycan-binding domain-containing protein [Afipia sp. P52-10]ETR76036.1 peptidoglycan-binding protein [Afipia sp. P52-10]